MDEGLIIEGISFQGRCGVSIEERSVPQHLLADLEFACSAADAIQTDALSKTIDYAQVSSRVVDIGRSEDCALLETLADRLCRGLLAEFPIHTLRIWLRKANPPLDYVTGSVGVRLTYHRSQPFQADDPSGSSPSSFLMTHSPKIPPGKVLDLACGSGRHAIYLAKQHYEVVGIDRNSDALATLSEAARRQRLSNLTIRKLDLEGDADNPPFLGDNQFAGLIVFFYLYRPLFPSIIKAIKTGGVLIYETFLIDNHRQFHHPRREEFCLHHNELLHLTKGLRVLHYEEGHYHNPTGQPSPITARLVAQKP